MKAASVRLATALAASVLPGGGTGQGRRGVWLLACLLVGASKAKLALGVRSAAAIAAPPSAPTPQPQLLRPQPTPVPGGPHSSAPRGGSIPRFTKRSGCSSGSSTTSCRRMICSSQPPTSLWQAGWLDGGGRHGTAHTGAGGRLYLCRYRWLVSRLHATPLAAATAALLSISWSSTCM